MKEKKYYFIKITQFDENDKFFGQYNEVIDENPILVLKELNKNFFIKYILDFYQEITLEEFNLYLNHK